MSYEIKIKKYRGASCVFVEISQLEDPFSFIYSIQQEVKNVAKNQEIFFKHIKESKTNFFSIFIGNDTFNMDMIKHLNSKEMQYSLMMENEDF